MYFLNVTQKVSEILILNMVIGIFLLKKVLKIFFFIMIAFIILKETLKHDCVIIKPHVEKNIKILEERPSCLIDTTWVFPHC